MTDSEEHAGDGSQCSSDSPVLPRAVEAALACANAPSPMYSPTSSSEDLEPSDHGIDAVLDAVLLSEDDDGIDDGEWQPRRACPPRRRLVQHAVAEKCRARGAMSGRRPLEQGSAQKAGTGHIGGSKARRVQVGDAAESAAEDQALGALADDEQDLGERQLRPYAEAARYGPEAHRNRRHRLHRGRHARSTRALCPVTLLSMSACLLVLVLEKLGFLPPRPSCSKCGRVPADQNIRVKLRTEFLPGPGEMQIPHHVEHAYWQCPGRCSWSPSVLSGAEILVPGYSLKQNACLMYNWCRMQQPSCDDLAEFCLVDNGQLEQHIASIRDIVCEVQEEDNLATQLGGPGVDVEADEVCFRARWVLAPDPETGERVWCREWVRWLAFIERGSSRIVFRQLETRVVKGDGQGGGGALGNQELHDAIFVPGRPPLLKWGTVLHTDGAKAYRNLAHHDDIDRTTPPTPAVIDALLNQRPTQWRWESDAERQERYYAETKEELGGSGGRSEQWSRHYRELCLSHTSVVHCKKVGQNRQFVAMRRVRLHPDVAAVVAARGDDPFLNGCITWRKGGTQTVDGHWKLLRKRAGLRGVNTKHHELLRKLVWVHQWSHWRGPGSDLFCELGSTVAEARVRRSAARNAAMAAWENAGMSSEDEVVAGSPADLERARQRRQLERGMSLLVADAEKQQKAATRQRVAQQARQEQIGTRIGDRLVRRATGAPSHALRPGTGRGTGGRSRACDRPSVPPSMVPGDAVAEEESAEEPPLRLRHRRRVLLTDSEVEPADPEPPQRSISSSSGNTRPRRSLDEAVADLLREQPILARGGDDNSD